MLDLLLIPWDGMSFWNSAQPMHPLYVCHLSLNRYKYRMSLESLLEFIFESLHLVFAHGQVILWILLFWKINELLSLFFSISVTEWNEFRLGKDDISINFLRMIAFLFRTLGNPCWQVLFYYLYQLQGIS